MIRSVLPSAARDLASTPLKPAPPSDDSRLKKTAQQLEGLFVEQLFKAMRETVPQDGGAFGAPQGEDMFTGLMDQRLATETPTQWAHGLADAAYRQLQRALPSEATDLEARATDTTHTTHATRTTNTTIKGPQQTMPLPNASPAIPLHNESLSRLTP